MRKKINLTAIVTGAAALFLGLAGNTHAIPISTHYDLGAGMHSWIILSHEQNTYEAAHSFDQSSHNQSLASPTAFFRFRPVAAQNAGETPNIGSLNFSHHGFGVPAAAPPLTGQEPNFNHHGFGVPAALPPLAGQEPNFNHHRRGVSPPPPPLIGPKPVSTTSPPLTAQEPNDSPTSVPDGGTTAMMMAGAVFGLAFLGKKLEV